MDTGVAPVFRAQAVRSEVVTKGRSFDNAPVSDRAHVSAS
jgi:hypothetical protein